MEIQFCNIATYQKEKEKKSNTAIRLSYLVTFEACSVVENFNF